jgi:diamine N-acetyltransferase
MTTRNATIADIPLIQELADIIWRPTYKEILTPEQIEYMLGMMYSAEALQTQMEQGHTFILLYDGEKAIGFASYSASQEPDIYKLNKIYLDYGYQGKGVGKLLLNSVIDAVKALNAQILELDVNRYNKAKSFYEKQGFEVYKEKDTHIGNGYWMNDYEMRKPL